MAVSALELFWCLDTCRDGDESSIGSIVVSILNALQRLTGRDLIPKVVVLDGALDL